MKSGRSNSIVILFVLVYLAQKSSAQTANGTNTTNSLPRNMNGPALLRNMRLCSCPWPGLINKQAYDNCTVKANSSSAVIYNRMCRFDCAMNYMSYKIGNAVNYTRLATRFKQSARSLGGAADNATSFCSSYVERFNNSIPIPQPPSGVTVCNPKALLVWACIRQQFILQTCSVSTTDTKCYDSYTRLKAMTPLDLLLN